METPNKHH
jgi:hypothetical protein